MHFREGQLSRAVFVCLVAIVATVVKLIPVGAARLARLIESKLWD